MLNKKVTSGEVLEESDLEPVSAGLKAKQKISQTTKSSQKLTKQSEKAAAKVAKVAKNADKVLKARALDKGL